jgi:hypothetical protein
VANTMAHDPAGWKARCTPCGQWTWRAWNSAKARGVAMELDEVTPHACAAERAS